MGLFDIFKSRSKAAPSADDRFELPPGWKGAAFPEANELGSAPSRPHPSDAVVLRRVERGEETAFGVWDSSTGRLVRFLPGAADARWTPDGRHLVVASEALAVTVLAWPGLAVRQETRPAFDTGCGVGGLELVISGSGRCGALWIYSGQSEEGYALFSLPDGETLGSLPYVAGESASPCLFTPDERQLVFVLEPNTLWWAGDVEDADWDTPAKGGPVHWATLHTHETRKGGAHAEYPILVDLPRGWVPGEDLACATWPRNVRFADAQRLVFDVPWGGECSIPFQPSGSLFAPAPVAGPPRAT
jgi:hypothetical protein